MKRKTKNRLFGRSMAFAAASAVMASSMYAPLSGTGADEWVKSLKANAEGATVSPDSFSVDEKLYQASESFTEGDYTYTLNNDGDAVISAYSGKEKDIVIPDTLGGKTVVMIGKEAFMDNTDITSVKIPASVKRVYEYAFCGATSLASIEFSEGLETLDRSCFANTAIKDVKLPSTIKSTSRPFYGCELLEKAEFAEGSTMIPDGSMNYDTYGSTNFGCFENCTALKEVILPEGITSIGGFAFEGCAALAEIKIPSTVTRIGEKAFEGCTSLKSIELPEGLKELEYAIFNNVPLESVKIPSTVTKGSRPFAGCNTLKKVEIAEGTKTLASGLSQYLEDIGMFEGNTSIEEVVLPEGLEVIKYRDFYGCTSLKKINFPSTLTSIYPNVFCGCTSLTSVELNEGLKSLNSNCFSGTGLTYVKIPSTVTYAVHPFQDCEELKKVEFAEGMKTTPSMRTIEDFARVNESGIFANCPALEEIVFPSTLEDIGHYAFCNCPSLKNVTIPDTIKRIGSFAFSGDNGITSIELPEGIEKLYISAFGDTNITSVKIPKSVTFGALAFQDCELLKKVEFEDGMTAIPAGAIGSNVFGIMDSCPALEEVIIPDSVTELEYGVFADCPKLKKITLPESVTYIGTEAFSGCSALNEINIPSAVTEVGSRAFQGTSLLKEIDLPEGLETLGTEVFKDSGIKYILIPSTLKEAKKPFAGCKSLKKAEFADGTTVIHGGKASNNGYLGLFQDCTSLNEVNIPDNVTEIEAYAFSGCSSLTDVKLPSALKTIGACAFENASSLTTIEFPDGIEDIGTRSFAGTALSSVVIPSSVTSGSRTFENCEYLTYAEVADGLKVLPSTLASISFSKVSGTYGLFAACPVLREVKIPDSLEVIDEASFRDCPELVRLVGGKDNIEFRSQAFDGCISLQDERFLILDKANTYLTANSIITSVNGTTNFTLKYKVADRFKNKASKQYIRFEFPKGMELIADTYRCSDPDADIHSYGPSNLYVEPEATEFTVTFSCNIKNSNNLKVDQLISLYLDNYYHQPVVGKFEMQSSAISLGGPASTSKPSADVYGIAEKGEDVDIYVDGKLAETVSSSDKTGKYRATVKFPDAKAGDRFTVFAKCGGYSSEKITIVYTDNMPSLTSAVFSDDFFRRNHDITEVFTEGKCPVITTYIGLGMQFKMKIANSDKINHLYLTSKKGDDVKFIEAVYDKKNDEWTATDRFDPNDRYYIPGYLNISAVTESEYPTVDLDNDDATDTFRIDGYNNDISNNSYATALVSKDDRLLTRVTLGNKNISFDYGYFSAVSASLPLDGNAAEAKTVCASPEKFGFRRLPLNTIQDGDECEYYYRLLDSKQSKAVVDRIFDAKDTADFNEHKSIVLIKKNSKTPEFMVHGVSDLTTGNMDSIPFGMLGIIGSQLSPYGNTLELRKEMTDSDADELLDVLTLLYGSKLMNVVAEGELEQSVKSVGGITGPWSIAADSAIILDGAEDLNSYGRVMAEQNQLFSNPGYIRLIIDPSGRTYEAVKGNPVEDVSVTIYYKDENGNEVKWDADEYDQDNPILTDPRGGYAWDVPEGEWKVKASKKGYEDAESEWLKVPPAWTDVDIAMISYEEPVLEKAECVDGKVTVHFSKFMDVSTVSSGIFSVSGYSDISIEPVLLSKDDAYTDTFIITGKVNKNDIKNSIVTVKASGAAKSYSGVDLKASEVSAKIEGDVTAVVTTTTAEATSTTTTTSTTATAGKTTAVPTTTTKAATTTTTSAPTTTTTKAATTTTTKAATTTTTSAPTTTTTKAASTTTAAAPTTTTTKAATTTTTSAPTTTTTKAATTTTTSAPTTTTTKAATTTTTLAPTTTTTKPVTTTTAITSTAPATTTYSMGDVNGDNIIDGRDATAVLTEYAKTSTGKDSTFDDSQKAASDVNNDGIIDGRDATWILTYYAYTSTGHDITFADFITKGKVADSSSDK